ncbi:MAG: sigma-70 family RNA polymerase sigma factor [Bacteroidota bacterium]
MAQALLNPDKWISEYADALYSYTLPRVNDTALAEDIVQETFLSAWKARDSFKGEASEKSWLFTICKNKIIDHYRKKARDIVQPISDNAATDVFFDDAEHWTQQDKPLDWGLEQEQAIDKKEFYKVLEGCKKKLQEVQRAVFSMKYLEDLDSAQICKALGLTSSNYWVLIHRAKLQLRACLEKNWINSK